MEGVGASRVLQLCCSLAAFLCSKCDQNLLRSNSVLLKIHSIRITQATAAHNNLLPKAEISSWCDLPLFKHRILLILL